MAQFGLARLPVTQEVAGSSPVGPVFIKMGMRRNEPQIVSTQCCGFFVTIKMRVFHNSFNVAVTGPCYGEKTPPLHVGLWENLSLAMLLAGRPHHSCSSGSPDPDPFVIRRSQTTEVGPMPSCRRDILVPIRWASRPGGFSYRETIDL